MSIKRDRVMNERKYYYIHRGENSMGKKTRALEEEECEEKDK